MKKKFLVVKFGRTVARADAEDIIYILRDRGLIIVSTTDKEYVYSESMEEAKLIMGPNYFRPRDHMIVNMEYLKEVDVTNRKLYFRNGDALPLGRDASAALKRAFERYLIENCVDDYENAAEEEADYSEKGLATKKTKL